MIELFANFAPPAASVLGSTRPASPLWGYILPGAIFAAAFAVTWALYRRFAGRGRRG